MTSQQARWGHITRLKVVEVPIMLPMPKWQGGGEYPSGDTKETWTLVCDCGHKWDLDKADFPGKYTLRHCGRAECQYSQANSVAPPSGRPRLPSKGVVTQIYMPIPLYYRLIEIAEREVTSYSKLAARILQEYVANLDSISAKKPEPPPDEGGLVPVPPDEPTEW